MYHLFSHDYDGAGRMHDYVGKFESIDAILDYLSQQPYPNEYGSIVQINGDDLQWIASIKLFSKFAPRKDTYQWMVTFEYERPKVIMRKVERLKYSVDLPDGYYAKSTANGYEVLVPETVWYSGKPILVGRDTDAH